MLLGETEVSRLGLRTENAEHHQHSHEIPAENDPRLEGVEER
jgi:hypothetical protein